ncbi:MAG: hypothetical protein EXQ52_04045 [Bryobacterales bacterium]|nr:hypothetical protein [Bryobacterales bacterium]
MADRNPPGTRCGDSPASQGKAWRHGGIMISMPAVLDHVFICTAIGAPAAGKLRQLGLQEGSPNWHPGQGTACRRFFFHNAMLELVWVENETEARSEQTRDTRLWERWSGTGRATSPFGILLRPEPPSWNKCPFDSWDYQPKTMPGLSLQIATATGIEEPMWCYMEGGRPYAEAPPERRQPMDHPGGFREITGVRIVGPSLPETSVTQAMARENVIALGIGAEHLLQLQFDDGKRGGRTDLRPDLPLICIW